MTLAVGIIGEESIWLLVDRRISQKPPGSFVYKPLREDAVKVLCLHATDGVALLGYSGLGLTPTGMEPSTWMSNVLRGVDLPLEQSLGVLVDAARQELPRHLERLGGSRPQHHIIVPALVNRERRSYSVGVAVHPEKWLFVRNQISKTITLPPPLIINGSGAKALQEIPKYARRLLDPVRLHDEGKLDAYAVADGLAKINYTVHVNTTSGTVGPDCIVMWRLRLDAGGAHQFYSGTERSALSSDLPTISQGFDMSAFFKTIMPHMPDPFLPSGEPDPDYRGPDPDAVNADLAKLVLTPDRKLK